MADEQPPYLVIGLGNPGDAYRNTRHNVGFLALDALAGPGAFTRRGTCLVREGELGGLSVVFCKPQVFMNRSGEAVAQLLATYGSAPVNVVLLYDDAEIPFGQVRVRERGSHGGHNGMRSISEVLRTQEVPRIRIGIGQAQEPAPLRDHVLQELTDKEREGLTNMYRGIGEAVVLVLRGQAAKAMSLYNRRDLSLPVPEKAAPGEPPKPPAAPGAPGA